MDDIKELKTTLRFMESTIPGATFKETIWGGSFTKGGRKINVVTLPYKKYDKDYLNNGSFKIRKMGNEYGVALHPAHSRRYDGILKLVKRGLGVK